MKRLTSFLQRNGSNGERLITSQLSTAFSRESLSGTLDAETSDELVALVPARSLLVNKSLTSFASLGKNPVYRL